jgi:hypothetical protein
MHVPTEEELAAIAVAYLAVQRPQTPPVTVGSRWRLAARSFAPDEPRVRWRSAGRIR